MNEMMDNPTMPWNQRTWIDTFWRNAALDKHLLQLIVAKERGDKRKKIIKVTPKLL